MGFRFEISTHTYFPSDLIWFRYVKSLNNPKDFTLYIILISILQTHFSCMLCNYSLPWYFNIVLPFRVLCDFYDFLAFRILFVLLCWSSFKYNCKISLQNIGSTVKREGWIQFLQTDLETGCKKSEWPIFIFKFPCQGHRLTATNKRQYMNLVEWEKEWGENKNQGSTPKKLLAW